MVYKNKEEKELLKDGQAVWMCNFDGCIYLKQVPAEGIVVHKIYDGYSTVIVQHKNYDKRVQHISNVTLADTYEEIVAEYNKQVQKVVDNLMAEANEMKKEIIL